MLIIPKNSIPGYHSPTLVVWELTRACNLHCLHCGSAAGKKRNDELTTNEALTLCDDLATLGFKGIALMGGEIFLHTDWEKISKKIKDLGLTLSIITNGFFPPQKFISKLTALNTDCVMVGLDGASEKSHDHIRGTPHSFQKAIAFLRATKQAHLYTCAITTVHKHNFQELPKIKELLLQEHINWQIQDATPIGRFPKNLLLTKEEYYTLGLFIKSIQNTSSAKNQAFFGTHNLGFHSRIIPNLSPYPEWNGCYAGTSILGIQSNGNIKGCLALSDEFIEGNIRKHSIFDIWNNPKAFAYTRAFTPQNLQENCQNCPFGPTCKGGCTTRSASITGVAHNDPYCYYRYEKDNHL